MGVAVARELVPFGSDCPDEVGVALGGHAEDEEGRLRVQLAEEFEDRRGLTFERLAALVPVVAAEAAVHELVPVLEVDREQELGHGMKSKIDRCASSLRRSSLPCCWSRRR